MDCFSPPHPLPSFNPSATSRCGGLLPSASADARSSDDVIALFEGPAYLSQLASVGVGLEHLANPANDQTLFAAAVANVPALLANVTAELGKSKSPRVGYTLDLLAM